MPRLHLPLRAVSLALASGLLLAACSSTPLGGAPATDGRSAAVPDNAAAAPAARSAVAPVAAATPGPDLAGPPGTAKTIYFDYDSAFIKPEFRSLIDAHARYLASHRDGKLTIRGNTDERGGSEYNLALGQRRAQAVLDALQLLGAPANRMEAISFGKEKPVATGHDESAWALNRRAELGYR